MIYRSLKAQSTCHQDIARKVKNIYGVKYTQLFNVDYGMDYETKTEEKGVI